MQEHIIDRVFEEWGDEPQRVACGAEMPVCLQGDLLQFTEDAHLFHHGCNELRLSKFERQGNTYDGASIPRWAWSIIGHPLEQRFRWPSYWHDRLCESSRTWADRRLADAVLLVLLEEAGVGYWRRTAMWLAVRAYAWFIWKGPMAC